MPKIIGIDLGTTNSVAAIVEAKILIVIKNHLFNRLFSNFKKLIIISQSKDEKNLSNKLLSYFLLKLNFYKSLVYLLKNPLFRPILSIKP